MQITHDGVPVELPASRKSRALLGYLAATSRAHTRERLCELLYDTPGDPRAALRWSLWKVRPLVDSEHTRRIVASRTRVSFEAHDAVVDLGEVRAALVAGVVNTPTDVLVRVASLFRGDFLEGLDLDECFIYHEWWRAERDTLRRLHSSVLPRSSAVWNIARRKPFPTPAAA